MSINHLSTEEEIKSHIQNLANNKSLGADGIATEFKGLPESSPSNITLFNNILDSCNFPDISCTCIILSLFKSGSKDDVNNYTGISFTSILNTRI